MRKLGFLDGCNNCGASGEIALNPLTNNENLSIIGQWLWAGGKRKTQIKIIYYQMGNKKRIDTKHREEHLRDLNFYLLSINLAASSPK